MSVLKKEELIALVAQDVKITKLEARKIIELAIEHSEKALEEGKTLDIFGFGKFIVQDVPERNGINPATGERITVSARRKIKFAPAKQLKGRVNKA